MTGFRAWHLPQLETAPGHPLMETVHGPVLAPGLTPAAIGELAAALIAAGGALRAMVTDDVVQAIDRVAHRFLDPADPLRQDALTWLPAVTGYGEAMATLVLDRMAADWTADSLRRLLRAEFRDPAALERFVRHAPGQRARAVPPRLILHVLAGNVPGVGVTSLVRGLLVRAPGLCKSARAEPVLPALFARALHEADPRLGNSLAVTCWTGGDDTLEQPALAAADTVVHYGGSAAIRDLQGRLPPHVRLLEHGPRASFALVAREFSHRRRTIADAARAVAIFDQQGCVSPHVVYVEQGGRLDPVGFAAALADQLDHTARELPRGRLSTDEAATVQQLRATAEFRALAGENTRLWTGHDLAWTVIYDDDPAFTTSCLNRTIRVKPLPRLEDVIGRLHNYIPYLQSAALAAPPARLALLAEQLALAGCSRITTLAAMPFPPASWHHDGRGPLRELVRWADWESTPK